MKIRTHNKQVEAMIKEIFLEETGNIPDRAVRRVLELFEDFETADIETITLSKRAYLRTIEESKQAGIVIGRQEAANSDMSED